MADIFQYIILFSLNAATLCLLFAMLFINRPQRWWLRLITILTGVIAVLLPHLFLSSTLGYPDPWPRSGLYDVLGWHLNEPQKEIYLFVGQGSDPIPRHYKVPFELQAALALQQAQEDLSVRETISVRIEAESEHDTPAYQFLVRSKDEDDEQGPDHQGIFSLTPSMAYTVLLALHASCILIMFLAIWVQKRWFRAVAALAGAVALWLPLFIQLRTLGLPNPRPPQEDFELLATQVSPSQDFLYIYVDSLGQDYTPKLYRIPFVRRKVPQVDTQADADTSLRIIRFEPGETGELEMVYIDHAPPDLIKGEPRRGTRYQ